MAHRLLIMAALCPGTTDINCNATSKDIEATVSCLEALGARIATHAPGL
jgi:3-phosphoshikimate 1-carboxyvinyltransferase